MKLTYQDVVFEEGPCPLCGAQRPSPPILTGYDSTWRKEGTFTLVRCQECELVYQSPRPTRETMRYYYEDCYSGEKEEEMRTFMLESGFSRMMSVYRVATIEKVTPMKPGMRVLDIGASYGAFIEHARVKRGIEAYAIDLDPGSIEKFVNTEDIDVRCGDVLEGMYETDYFDVITLLETLEHVYDPVVVLEEVRRILKPGGLVSLEVPNWDAVTRMVFGSWWLPLLLPTHLQHFSRRHLAMCAERAGLEPVHQQAMFYPGEVTMSFGVGYGRIFGNPPDEERGVLRRAVDLVVGLFLMIIFVLIDLPVVFTLRLFGRSGHQTLIARKPTN
ncbi:MAG: hypothetical protein CMH57_07775 [Myxococcales bacterium]|nr:hypothetical protein [Myxococcales bacterium]